MWQTYKIQVYPFTCLICLEILAIKQSFFEQYSASLCVERLLLPFNEYFGVYCLDHMAEVGVIF